MRLLHTADLQLGRAFRTLSERARSRAQHARMRAWERVVDEAKQREVDALLVAGDFFDVQSPEPAIVAEALECARRSTCPVLLLPGNHDHAGFGSVYLSEEFLRRCPDTVRVLDGTPLPIADGVILSAPLYHRQGERDPTLSWTRALGSETPGVRVGVAHGSVRAFREAGRADVIDTGVVDRAGLDYLALGDWHGRMEVTPRAWYAGTPEMDRFPKADQEAGSALLVEIDAPGATPRVEALAIGDLRWIRHEAQLLSRDDVLELERWFEGLERPERTLVRLELEGVLSLDAHQRLVERLAHHEPRLVELRQRGHVIARPEGEELDQMRADPFLASVIDALEGDAASLALLGRLFAVAEEQRHE